MPETMAQHEKGLQDPAVCELLPMRDFVDGVMVRTNGSLVAGYQLRGVNAYFANDEERNRSKIMLGALLKSIPEQSMRMQVRYEVTEDNGSIIEDYDAQTRLKDDAIRALDAARIEAWIRKAASGHYLRPMLHVYFIWDPKIHHRVTGKPDKQPLRFDLATLSVKKAVQRTREEHERLVTEFESLLVGIEATMEASAMGARRMDEQQLFLEAKRALNPLQPDSKTYIPGEEFFEYRSSREQIADVSILNEAESYINIDGLLYSVVSLKDLPDATFPGILRELSTVDFPLVVNAQVVMPDQTKVLKGYKSRLRKMQAAQRDTHGGFRTNVEAQVAESQLFQVQQEIIASSLKTAKLSLTIVTRTSQPAMTRSDYEEAERLITNRRQQLLYAIARMNGAKAVAETMAKRRLYVGSLPGMGEMDRREHDMLSPNAADLLPVEMPWEGTPRSPLFLLETPYRQLIPFSPFDPSFSDGNILAMATIGGGKTMMIQMLLSMAARTNPVISIIERGDSYRPLVELMGGQMVSMSLDSDQTLNAWDLPKAEREPGKDQIAFLRNLARHMMGEGGAEDTDLLDNLLTDAIQRTYRRAAIRQSNPIPTFSDLRDELAQWRDEDKNPRVMDEAHLAAIKLRSWTGEKGPYSKLFDRPTTISLSSSWLYFNIEKLDDDERLKGAMSLVIARAMSLRSAGDSSRPRIVIMDEFSFILDSPVLAPEAVQLFRTARKRGVIVCGISQTVEDYVGTKDKPRLHGPGIVKNSNIKIIGRQPGDSTPLVEHMHLSDTSVHTIKQFSGPRKGRYADALIVIGEKAETTHSIRMAPTPLEYWIMTTYPRERLYRAWWLRQYQDLPLIVRYQKLAEKFPQGLAELDPLPEETSGRVGGT